MNIDALNSEKASSEPLAQIYRLPNGISIYHINKHETDFLYKEMFQERAYLKHGITLSANACVFDVGANIGMFTLFVKQECADAKVYAFEPNPEIAKIMKMNVDRFGKSVKVYQNGISNREGEASFTCYHDYSIMSGFHANASGDADILSSGIRNQLTKRKVNLAELPDDLVDSMVQKKLGNKTEIKCQLKTISSFIRETEVEQIDLLKIDAERSELAIMEGIQKNDWPKIKQIVLEVHSSEEVERVKTLLELEGFKVIIEQEDQFANSGVFNFFAKRI